ncbi:DUF1829 domain-containing protein [Peptoniphilus indolicus]|nr:DUF1829 domain-containing protein [Peptoniphilus indolicus]SUB74433.1 Domain of uncharacterised function DUF1829 [Peptoniphilus indolicus]
MTKLSLKTEYSNFLSSFVSELKINEKVTRITTPFLDSGNDLIEIYIEFKDTDSFYLTDDGITLADLAMKGVKFEKGSKRTEKLNKILLDHGVSSDMRSIYTLSSKKDLPLKLYFLAQAMQKVSDLYVLNKPSIINIFNEDVKTFFDKNNIRYMEDVVLMGKTNSGTKYDFIIPKSKKAPDRLIQTCNSIELGQTRSFLFGWLDTVDKRNDNSKLYVIYNDEIKKTNSDIEDALNNYGAKSIPWSKRVQYKNLFVA